MDFAFTEAQEKFRQEVQEFLKKEVTPELLGELEARGDRNFSREFSKKVAQKGWIGLAWPKEYGGKGMGHLDRLAYWEEMSYHEAPWGAHFSGDRQIGLSIIRHGTEQQKREFLPRIVAGDISICLGYSEPGAGSDLASLNTRAVLDGDDYVVNGQKIWTSGAQRSDYMWLACRTDPKAPKHRGISVLLLNMTASGITIRPLPQMTGEVHFNEVFFDNVRVPKRNLVGEENRGWYVVAGDLDFERSGIERVTDDLHLFERIVDFAREAKVNGQPLADRPLLRHRLAELAIEFKIGRLLAYRVAWLMEHGKVPNYEASMSKAYGSELAQRVTKTGMELLGLYGQLEPDSQWAPLKGKVEKTYLRSVSDTIRGGTSEIMRNIIAMRGLGLPRD